MNHAPCYETDSACAECGRFGAFAFDGERLCVDCYQQRGSCCAERACGGGEPVAVAAVSTAASATSAANTVTLEQGDEILRLNPNCCYSACPRCASMRRLRQFQAQHPHDWHARLRGFPRLVQRAQGRD